jgi:hypothetical protein
MAPPENHVDFYHGWSFAVARTARGVAAHDSAVARGVVKSIELTDRETKSCNVHMSSEKRWRAFRVIETHRRQGKAIPNYGDSLQEFPRHKGLQFLKTELHMISHIFCYLPRWRAGALRFFLGNGGYFLFWLNHKRRALRFFLRDSREWLRRSVLGRS